jgi:DNA-binding protein HU-beta
MHKIELVTQVSEKADISLAQAQAAVTLFSEAISHTLGQGEDVSLVGFGTFTVKARAAREGRNPQTGAPIQIAAAKVPAFKPGKTLKNAVNQG